MVSVKRLDHVSFFVPNDGTCALEHHPTKDASARRWGAIIALLARPMGSEDRDGGTN